MIISFRKNLFAHLLFYGLVAVVVLAVELTFVRKQYERAETSRRAALQQLIKVGNAVDESSIPSKTKANILRGIVNDIGLATGRRPAR